MTDLPKGWEWVELAALGDEVRGSVVPKAGQPYELYSVPALPSGVPELVDGSDIGSGKRPVAPGDVLLCKINPRINRVWQVSESRREATQVASTEFLVLRVGEPVLASYLRWYFQSPRFRSWIELSVEGATGSHTRAKSGPILRQEVPIPPARVQERIVAAVEEHFSRVEAAEAAVAEARTKLDVHDRATIASLMSGRDDQWTTLGEIAEVRGGVTKDAKKQGDPTFVEVPYLRVANVQRGHLVLDEVTKIRVDQAKLDALRLQPGDMLFNEGGDRDKLGRGWVWEGQIDDCIHQNHVFRGRLTSPGFDPYFVSTHANTWGQAWFEKHGRQTTNLASISLSALKRLPVPAPSLEEQERIVAALRDADDVRSRLDGALKTAQARAKALRRSILDAAFSGKLVPQDPGDEPASVLLERIRAERDAAGPRRRTRS